VTDGRRFELPDGLSREEERQVFAALERYFRGESPRPRPWALAGRLEATGVGALQARRLSGDAWRAPAGTFVRPGVFTLEGRGDAR